jgi:hypothetical protein
LIKRDINDLTKKNSFLDLLDKTEESVEGISDITSSAITDYDDIVKAYNKTLVLGEIPNRDNKYYPETDVLFYATLIFISFFIMSLLVYSISKIKKKNWNGKIRPESVFEKKCYSIIKEDVNILLNDLQEKVEEVNLSSDSTERIFSITISFKNELLLLRRLGSLEFAHIKRRIEDIEIKLVEYSGEVTLTDCFDGEAKVSKGIIRLDFLSNFSVK